MVVNRLMVVVISVLVILGVMVDNVVCCMLDRLWKVFMIFYMVLNRLMYGLIELMDVRNGRCDLSEFILCW